ncbi:hypothetical protein T05_4233, partial [Trichinella murrelli]
LKLSRNSSTYYLKNAPYRNSRCDNSGIHVPLFY